MGGDDATHKIQFAFLLANTSSTNKAALSSEARTGRSLCLSRGSPASSSKWSERRRSGATGSRMIAAPSSDEQHLRRALDLARAGIGLVSPNPAVGAVVVDASGRELGAGTHTYDGVKHAEVLALEQAGHAARGGTLFPNLEPCSHQGRTGPCADAVVAAGIRRVICSMKDPNPKVAGQGFAKLRASGITVEIGLFEAGVKKLYQNISQD